MSDAVIEIRKKLNRGANVIGKTDARALLDRIAELEGKQEMWAANADEAALKMARLQARVTQLESTGDHLFEELAKDNAYEELKRQYIARRSVV